MPDAPFDVDAIRGSTFVRHVEIHDTLASTNDRAAELARIWGVPLPALVVARQQTAGRGRGANQWWSSEGALTFSLLLDAGALGISAAKWPLVSLATAVAICDALSAELRSNDSDSASPHLKWPNDVLLDYRKISGILIEAPARATAADRCLIVGIGINVNNSMNAAPAELRAQSIALCDASHRTHSLQEVLTRVLDMADHRLQMLASNESYLHSHIQRRCLLTGKYVQVASIERNYEGVCAGIAENGALLVDTRDGRAALFSGTVRMCDP
jgi:BirA family biotin operon repressor/biotin-[acetyl-CoA-carboxylase] ligase